MRWSIAVGKVKGTIVRIHLTFLILLAWIVFAAYAAKGSIAAASAGLFFVLLFASVLLHEFGHILVAGYYGVRTPTVTLLPIGGVSQMERIPEQPYQELVISLAGPAVNLILGGAIALALGGLPSHPEMGLADFGRVFWTHLAFANLALALFNLLPAFPMDGGRALRAVLSARLGYARGTKAAAVTGQVLAVLFGLFGIYSGNLILTLIALFVYFTAAAETGGAKLRSDTLGTLAGDFMITRFETLRPDAIIDSAVEAVIRTYQREFLILDAQGQLQGVLTRDQIAGAIKKNQPRAKIREVMNPEVQVVSPNHLADHALRLLQGGAPAVAVVNDRGQLVGMITLDNVMEHVLLTSGRREVRPASGAVSVPHVASTVAAGSRN